MAIYSRYGGTVTIVSNCGDHKPKGLAYPATLLRVEIQFTDGSRSSKTFYFLPFLKADEGAQEIMTAVKIAPVEVLPPHELRKAIEDAL